MPDQKNNSAEDAKKDQQQEQRDDIKVDNDLDLEKSKKDAEDKEKNVANIEFLQEQLKKIQDESKENLDKVLRAQAEMENLRKRTIRDVENAHKYALEKFINELLPILDSLELGLSASANTKNVDELYKGMELTLEMFNKALEKFGVKIIDPQGEKFNPELHEAVSMQEIEDSESGIIIAVMQKGYLLNDRLIRPAMVIVAK
jgi:molecular chaperone GrpE